MTTKNSKQEKKKPMTWINVNEAIECINNKYQQFCDTFCARHISIQCNDDCSGDVCSSERLLYLCGIMTIHLEFILQQPSSTLSAKVTGQNIRIHYINNFIDSQKMEDIMTIHMSFITKKFGSQMFKIAKRKALLSNKTLQMAYYGKKKEEKNVKKKTQKKCSMKKRCMPCT